MTPLIYIAAIFGSTIFTTALITGILIARKKHTPGRYDYLLVLGAAVRGAEPSVTLHDRLRAACKYLQADPSLICIVSGGKEDAKNLSEAQCMYNTLTQMGIPKDRIWLEDKAVSTLENLVFSKALIQEKTGREPGTLGVLSSDYHMFRVQMLAKMSGHEIIPLYAPSTKGPKYCIAFLREIIVIWYYAVFGI